MDGIPDGGRRPPFAYMTPQAGMFLSQMGLGGKWPGSAVPSGLGYPRRDLGGSMRGSWNPRGLPQEFLSAPQPAATLRYTCKFILSHTVCDGMLLLCRNVSMYSALQGTLVLIIFMEIMLFSQAIRKYCSWFVQE